MTQSMIYFVIGLAVLLVAGFMVARRYRRDHPEEGWPSGLIRTIWVGCTGTNIDVASHNDIGSGSPRGVTLSACRTSAPRARHLSTTAIFAREALATFATLTPEAA